ncbi:unnamed protein product [Staurois parvus]|uniref:Uncharacterized protein n=1 Tax=Staurois parvus TaxID=386267 RepID=A0ABN9G3U4_9NEOB|nr:unnamed protein product [Staurois parvus]
MQTASTNICKRMGCSQELSEFKRGTVIGCHLCNKSICEISLLLNIPRSTVSGINNMEATGNNGNSATKCGAANAEARSVQKSQSALNS